MNSEYQTPPPPPHPDPQTISIQFMIWNSMKIYELLIVTERAFMINIIICRWLLSQNRYDFGIRLGTLLFQY